MENLSEAARTKVRHVMRGLTGSQRVGQNAGDLTALGVEAGTGLALFKAVQALKSCLKATKSVYKGSKPNLEFDYSTPEAPFSLRIDPITGRGPMHIDSNGFTSATSYSKLGAKKNAQQFWKLWDEKHPGTLSNSNLQEIGKGLSPIVDSQWIQHFPEHQRFIDQVLEHHHIDHGHLTTPLPEKLHRGKGNTTIWHDKTRGDKQ